jgi:arginase
MLIINPQWQGSGLTDELKQGAVTLKHYFKGGFQEVPLSEKELTTVNGIKGYWPVLEQAESFRHMVASAKPAKLVTIGGDCGIEIIPVSYLNSIYGGDLCVVWIDAHADLNTPASSPSQAFHGMPLRTLLGEGDDKIKEQLFSFIKPEQICFVGLRDLDEDERRYIVHHDVVSLEEPDYNRIEQAVEEKGYGKVYIHLDLDVLDKAEYPHSLFPTDNGFKVEEVVRIIEQLRNDFDVVGLCITESTATTPEQLSPVKPILEQARKV